MSGPLPPFIFRIASVNLASFCLSSSGRSANKASYSLSPGPVRPSFLSSKKFSTFQWQKRYSFGAAAGTERLGGGEDWQPNQNSEDRQIRKPTLGSNPLRTMANPFHCEVFGATSCHFTRI